MGIKFFTGLASQQVVNDQPNPVFQPMVANGILVAPKETVESSPSTTAPFFTFFSDFDLIAEPVYNFFEEDESTNESLVRDDKKLDDLPRYIELKWNRPPQKKTTTYELTNKVAKVPFKNHADFISRNGASFTPSHLNSVTIAKKSTGNAHVSSYAISARVEVPIEKVPVMTSTEEAFLSSEKNEGKSFSEMVSNNLVAAKPIFLSGNPSLVDGKFLVTKNQGLKIRSAQSSSPSVSFVAAVVGQPVQEEQQSIAVNFVEHGIAGLFNPTKINLMTKPEHVESMLGLATIIPSLEALSFTGQTPVLLAPPSFPAPIEMKGITYVGYVIEKYKRNKTGFFELVDEIDIDDIEMNSFIDTKVAYGSFYRYRMKAIVRWTHEKSQKFLAELESIAGENADRDFGMGVCSYFDTEWSRQWATVGVLDLMPPNPADEVCVIPDSRNMEVSVTWKFPHDPQLDISGFIVVRKIVNAEGHDVERWRQISQVLLPRNGIFVDSDVATVEDNGGNGYVYAIVTMSKHGELSTLSDQLLCKLTESYRFTGEIPAVLYSEAGVDPASHGDNSVKPPKRAYTEMLTKKSVSLVGRLGQTNKLIDRMVYVMRLESLDTGEIKDLTVTVDQKTLETRRVSSKSPGAIAVSLIPKISDEFDVGPAVSQVAVAKQVFLA